MVALIQVGVDIGQRIDPTAIVIAELVEESGYHHYHVRHIEKIMLDTSYPAIVKRLQAIYAALEKQQRIDFQLDWREYFDRSGTGGAYPGFTFDPPTMYIDATGVGQPVVDMLKEAGLDPTPVYLTAGHQEIRERGEIHLPKNLLVSNLQVLLQNERIHFQNDNPEYIEASKELVAELLNYEIKVTESQNLKMGVFKLDKHDDLATALGLACRPYRDTRLVIAEAPDWLTTAGIYMPGGSHYGGPQ